VSVWAFFTIFIVFKVTDMVIGLRVSPQEELEGLDITEHGTISYPEFGTRVVNAQPGERVVMPVIEAAN
jgi:Amt family ammonium transporter